MHESSSPTKRNVISKLQGQPLQKKRSRFRSGPILLIIFGTSFVWVLVDLIILIRFIDTGEGVGFGQFGPIGQKHNRELRDKGVINDAEEPPLDTLHRGPGNREEGNKFKDINGMDKANAFEYIRRAKLKENLESRIQNLGQWIGLQKKQVERTADEVNKMSDRNGGKVKGDKGQGHREHEAEKQAKKKDLSENHGVGKDSRQMRAKKERERKKKEEEEIRKVTKKENAEPDNRIHFIDPQGNEVFGDDDDRPTASGKEETPMDAEAIAKFEEEKVAAVRAKVAAEWKRKQAQIANLIVMAKPEEEENLKKLEEKKKAGNADLELQKQQAFEIEMQQKLKERLRKENEGEERERQQAEAKAKRLKGKTEKDYYHIHGVVPVPYEPDYKPRLTEVEKRAQRGQLGIDKVINYDVTTFKRNPNGPGERGAGYSAPYEDKSKVKEGWKEAEFNQFASDHISVERSAKDGRFPECKNEYINYASLPQTSVIICFTEESWSTLLRTVHSVINRSPPQLLTEVILVDDFSRREYLKDALDVYMRRRFPKVRIIRLPSRQGLIRARLAGIKAAKGPVLTFLDSHIECNVGWLEPLLKRVSLNKKTVVCPVIDSISAGTLAFGKASESIVGVFDYNLGFYWSNGAITYPRYPRRTRIDPYRLYSGGSSIVGGFDWSLTFNWIGQINYPQYKRMTQLEPLRSPAMAGGLFSIDKTFFHELGLYDTGLDIWGGENIELSLKIWMCGGTLEILPCSRVAHIFRQKQPYDFAGKNNVEVFLKNSQRVAEVWMDKYKQFFYIMRPTMRDNSVGDLSVQRKLRFDLRCESFDWYLNNVLTSLYRPSVNILQSGKLQSVKYKKCIDHADGQQLQLYQCHSNSDTQWLAFVAEARLESLIWCLGVGDADVVNVKECNSNQYRTWEFDNGKFIDKMSRKCMAAIEGKKICLQTCSGAVEQKWKFIPF